MSSDSGEKILWVKSTAFLSSVDGYWDPSPVQYHEALVAGAYTARSRSSTCYHLHLNSWRGGREMESLQVSQKTYLQAVPGQSRVHAGTRSGKFGLEWLAGYRLETGRVHPRKTQQPDAV